MCIFLSQEAVTYFLSLESVTCMCTYLNLGLFVTLCEFVWGELANHKSSTHRPSSQGWASGVLLQSMYVVYRVVFGLLWLGFWVSFFCFLASMLYTCFSMYIYVH